MCNFFIKYNYMIINYKPDYYQRLLELNQLMC